MVRRTGTAVNYNERERLCFRTQPTLSFDIIRRTNSVPNLTVTHFPSEVILETIRYYLAYKLSYRDIEEIQLERGR